MPPSQARVASRFCCGVSTVPVSTESLASQRFARARHRRGFTLIETAIVAAVIGLLAAIVIPALETAHRNAQDKAIADNLRRIHEAAQQYFLETGAWTVPLNALVGSSPESYLAGIEPVRGENYPASIRVEDTQLSAGGVSYVP